MAVLVTVLDVLHVEMERDVDHEGRIAGGRGRAPKTMTCAKCGGEVFVQPTEGAS